MASIIFSEFAKENLAKLTKLQQSKLNATIEKIKKLGLDNIKTKKISSAVNDAFLIRVGNDLRIMAVWIDKDTLLIDDMFTRRNNFTSAITARRAVKNIM